MSDLQPVLDKLDTIIELLEKMIEQKEPHHPMPDLPDLPPLRDDFPPLPKHCSKCGIKLEGVMGYVCNVIDCPTGMGPVIC